MIDWVRVKELYTDFGEADFHEIVLMFLNDVEARFEGLRCSPNLAADLHGLKGSAANLGFRSVHQACEVAEKSLAQADVERVIEAYNVSMPLFLNSDILRKQAG